MYNVDWEELSWIEDLTTTKGISHFGNPNWRNEITQLCLEQ